MVVERSESATPVHKHEYPHWVLAVTGPVFVLTEKWERVLLAGEGIFVPAGLLHSVTPSEHGAEWIHFAEKTE